MKLDVLVVGLYKRYWELILSERDAYFVGRLAQYRYFNMDQVVAAAFKVSEQALKSLDNDRIGSPVCS